MIVCPFPGSKPTRNVGSSLWKRFKAFENCSPESFETGCTAKDIAGLGCSFGFMLYTFGFGLQQVRVWCWRIPLRFLNGLWKHNAGKGMGDCHDRMMCILCCFLENYFFHLAWL
ncbi:uncharacterized protein LOC127079347 [Lathyrus oleraceus]|uniref:uncharacterized protein LOC127079347 n=1 Tax=Pisum sativum TaxID=3888 RepID=UPI0021D1C56C|nr:uncharacterized protein LOC127079347 [Pisum sativum]